MVYNLQLSLQRVQSSHVCVYYSHVPRTALPPDLRRPQRVLRHARTKALAGDAPGQGAGLLVTRFLWCVGHTCGNIPQVQFIDALHQN